MTVKSTHRALLLSCLCVIALGLVDDIDYVEITDVSKIASAKEATQQLSDLGVDLSHLCHPTTTEYEPYIPLCDSNVSETSANEEMEDSESEDAKKFYFDLFMSIACIVTAAIAAGLTMGMLSLDPLELAIKMRASESEEEKLRASKVLPLIKNHHYLLVTLMLLNTFANESLPIFLDNLVPEYVAVILSVTVILIVGEIIPSALCTGPNQLFIAASMVPLVKMLQVVLCPLVWPISKTLDHFLGHDDDGGKYNRNEITALVRITHEEHMAEKTRRKQRYLRNTSADERTSLLQSFRGTTSQILFADRERSLDLLGASKSERVSLEVQSSMAHIHEDEVNVIEGALKMKTRTVGDIMVPWIEVHRIRKSLLLNQEGVNEIISKKVSRLPVYDDDQVGDKAVCGVFMIQQLIPLNPDHNMDLTVGAMRLRVPFCVSEKMNMVDLLNLLQTGGHRKREEGGHLALVCRNPGPATEALKNGQAVPAEAGLLGIVTLEDTIEEIIQEEIYDETDTTRGESIF